MDLKLKGKTALVMGSSGGIGLAIAKALVDEGVKVIINSRSSENCKKAVKEIGAFDYCTADLSQAGAGVELIQKAMLKLDGKLDILVANTGGPQKGGFSDITRFQWLEDFQSIWLSPVEAIQEALPAMKKNKFGRFIFVTSIAAKEPLPGLTTSNGLRAGLEGLSRSLAHEVAIDGITINILRPGYTNTDRLKELQLSEERVKAMVPAGRLGEPYELAAMAAFLCSPLAGYITGQAISVDGGVQKSI
jgi:3-oxoacyl-[acyl-carrier protein] reductase